MKTSVEKKPGVQCADGELKHSGQQSLWLRVAGGFHLFVSLDCQAHLIIVIRNIWIDLVVQRLNIFVLQFAWFLLDWWQILFSRSFFFYWFLPCQTLLSWDCPFFIPIICLRNTPDQNSDKDWIVQDKRGIFMGETWGPLYCIKCMSIAYLVVFVE